MNNNFIRYTILLFSIFTIFCIPIADSMSGKSHHELWNECMGIKDKDSKKEIEPLWNVLQKEIDNIRDFYRDLKREVSKFNRSQYSHRLLFHWGFNTNPRTFPPLIKCIKENNLTNEEKEKLFSLIIQEQSKRNKKIIMAIRKYTGIHSRRYSGGLATIIYNIHILGDYTTTNKKSLPKINNICKDIELHGFRDICNRRDVFLVKVRNELRSAQKPGKLKKHERVLNTIKRYLPLILNKYLKNTLDQRGIHIQKEEGVNQ